MMAQCVQQHCQCLAILLMISFSLTSGSYLGYPRINFAGFFRADANTKNNDRCDFLPDYDPGHEEGDWNNNGTNEFEWFENKVTSVFRQNGTESKDDPIIGKHVMSNLKRPFAKLVDLDIDAGKSTIYGMKFGIAKRLVNPEENIFFFGNWTRSVIGQDIWSRIACYSSSNTGGEPFQDDLAHGASATTVITDIIWNKNLTDFPVLEELKAASDAVGGTLSVRVTLSFYTRNLPSSAPYNFTLGYVMGTIGVPSPTDTLNVGGERILVPFSGSVPVGYEDKLKPGDLCYKQNLSEQTWVFKTPFEVDAAKKEVRVDFSNAFTVDFSNTLIDIGSLNLAISHEDGCVQILTNGAIPYLTEDWLQTYSGILTVSLETEELNNLQDNYALLVVQVYDNSSGDDTPKICGDFLSTGKTDAANVLSHEPEYFIRPTGYYVDRVSRGETSEITFYVTRYGDPVIDTYIRLVPAVDSLPKNGIIPDQFMKQISNGMVTFNFLTADKAPPLIRKYPKPFYCKGHPHMTLPVEGNVYVFAYQHCTSSDIDACSSDVGTYTPTFLYFSDIADVPDDKVNWVDHVGPVLSQYAQVSPIMNYILDMSNYTEVIELQNRELMKLALGRLFTDPGHMPTTRDLPPKRRAMILAWLNQDGQPLYDSEGTIPPRAEFNDKCVPPPASMLFFNVATLDPRCDAVISAGEHPAKMEPYYKALSDPSNPVVKARLRYKVKGRPLMGLQRFLKDKREGKRKPFELDQCQQGGVDALREQLQTAVQLEFATIPVYLTVLYSIVDGCNQEIYNRVRSVVMQEMVHMAQAANILIALGGDPVIDSPDFVPNFPTNLPGKILPGLTVSLRKLSLYHVKEVLMGIETPVETEVGDPPIISDELTIGAFYAEISTCIGELGDSIFKEPREDRQVQWPWTPSDVLGEVKKVTNVSEAQDGINMIVEQGEGTSKLDPDTTKSSDDLAHFFKFEEIVCGKELKYKQTDRTYSYSGDKVPFNADGVWNMRNDPKARDIQPHTNCYVEAKAFHQIFRNLLRNLNDTFNGFPERVSDTVLLMESLHVHAKKTMWTKFTPDSFYTCGPVWDYHWTAGVDRVGREGSD